MALQWWPTYTLKANSANNHGTEITDENYVTYQGVRYCISNLPDEPPGVNMVNRLTVDLKTSLIKIPITVNYTFSKGTVRPCIGIGLIHMFVLTQNKDFIDEEFHDRFGRSIPIYHLGFTADFDVKFMLKNRHSLFLNTAFDYTSTTEVNELYRFTDEMFSLTFGYRL